MPKTTHTLRIQKLRNRAFVQIDGKRIYLGPAGAPETEINYHRVLLEHLERRREPTATVTVRELCVAYYRWAQQYYVKPDGKPTSQQDHVRAAIARLRAQAADRPVGEYGPKRLKALQESMVAEGLARSTVNHMTSVVRAVFKWGVSEELVDPKVHQALTAVAGLRRGRSGAREPDRVRPVPQKHIEAVKPHVSSQVWAMVELQLLTAARPGEIVALRPCDIDMSESVWIAELEDHKTSYQGAVRTLHFGPRAQGLLRPWLLRAPDAYLFSPREAETGRGRGAHMHRRPGQQPNPRKTGRRLGEHYSTGSYGQAIAQACKKAGVPRWTPHRLRHTAATRVRKEHGLEAAQVVLGHATADVTQVYAERNEALARRIAEEMG